jgi:energy-converting hydrogenase Eha subunit E
MNIERNEVLQWTGAVAIIVGHVCNAVGPSAYPLNIVAFTAGTVCFGAWTVLVRNKPQFVVNAVALLTCVIGLVNAYA